MARQKAKLIAGKQLADAILLDLKNKIAKLPHQPGLAAVLVGNDPASQLYVNNKKKACHKIGIAFHEYLCGTEKFYPDISEQQLLEAIDWLNHDPAINGIIIQLPLPKKFNPKKIINQLNPQKDVDGFHPANNKKFLDHPDAPAPPLIQAIKLILQSTGQNLKNKKAVVVAKNEIFSSVLDEALIQEGIAPIVISPDDKKLATTTKTADILISIIGKKHFIKPEMIKPGAIVIDAGTILEGKNTLAGDVDPGVEEVAGWLTPVPGGVGPLTVAMLLKNVYRLAQPLSRQK